MAILHHNDSETPVPLRRLQPYTYDGRFPTTCRLKKSVDSLVFLTLVVNKKWANVSLNLETLCLFDAQQESSEETLSVSLPVTADCSDYQYCAIGGDQSLALVEGNKNHSNCASKLLLGNFTLVFALQGSLRVFLHSGQQTATVQEAETLVCERLDNSLPVDISMAPYKPNVTNEDGDPKLGKGTQ